MAGPTPLLGRDEQLSRLAEHLHLAGGGALSETMASARALVGGPAGIGKTRLLAELAAVAELAGVPTVVGHCLGPAGATISYLPFVELAGKIASLRPAGADRVRQRHPAVGRLLPGVGHPPAGTMDPGSVAEAVHALLEEAASDGPILVVLEDSHWADHSSRDLATLLLTRGFVAPVLLVVSYRSDDLHRRHPLIETLAGWTRLPDVLHLEVGPLSAEHIREIARAAGADEPALEAVTRRAEGNPFFAEELATAAPALGATLTRILRARIDSLSDEARIAVRTAALHGRAVPHDLLARVVPLDEAELDEAMREGVDSGVVFVDESGAYVFRHALLAEAAAEDLLPGERRRLHRAYVSALTDLLGPGTAAQLAAHALAAGDGPVVVEAAIAAGDAARAVGGPHEALAHFEQALTWMEEDDPRRDDVLIRAARAADAAGETARATGMLHDRATHPPADETPSQRARILAALAREARLVDVLPNPSRFAQAALESIPAEGGLVRLEVLLAYAEALGDSMRDEEALSFADEALELATDLGESDLAAEARAITYRSMRRVRAETEAEAWWAETMDSARSVDPARRIRLLLMRAYSQQDRGNYRDALAAADEGMALGDRHGIPWSPWASQCRITGAVLQIDLGELDAALARVHVPGPRGPEPRASHLELVGMLARDIRDQNVTTDEVDATRPAWDLDGFPAHIATLVGLGIERREGRVAAAFARVRGVLPILERSWGEPGQAITRYTAQLAGALADARERGETEPVNWQEEVEGYAASARAAVAAEPTGIEGFAWLERMEAELLRLHASPDAGPRWQAAAALFRKMGNEREAAWCATQADRSRESSDRPSGVLPTGAPLPTPREREVLELLAQGRTNGQVAAALVISRKTASVHVSNLLTKLGAGTRGEAVAIARRWGLLDD